MIKHVFSFMFFAALLFGCKKNKTTSSSAIPSNTTVQFRGADLSFLPLLEKEGTKFYTSENTQQDLLSMGKEKGVNIVRLRLWHTPSDIHSSTAEVEAFAQRIKSNGLNWWLNLHYSDWWADPANQKLPAAWQNLSFPVLADSVYNYTFKVMTGLKAKNILPAIVQIGNETNSGMLWSWGRVGGSFDNNWANYATLVKKGVDAVKAVDPSIKIMLHYAGVDGASWYFNNLKIQDVNYDIIGLSYYPWWHIKTLTELQTDLNNLASTFNKDIFIAETAYPFTTNWNDYTNNILGANTVLLSGYEATPAGQFKFLTDLRGVVNKIPNNRGIGFCYWAPDWVAFRGATSTNGSSWENVALFDFNNKALQGWNAFAQ